MTRRRELLRVAGAVCLPASAQLLAQTPPRVYRLGILRASAPAPELSNALLDTLRYLGYVEGRNLVVDRRFASGKLEQLGALARELIALRVDVMVCVGSAAVRAARETTSTVPILMFGNFDPVALGLVINLARPEANVTGILISGDGTLAAKRVELLREAVPRAARIAMLAPEDPNFQVQLEETRKAAAALKLELSVVEVRDGEYAGAFAKLGALRPDAMWSVLTLSSWSIAS